MTEPLTPEDLDYLRQLAFGPDTQTFTRAEMRGVLATLDAARASQPAPADPEDVAARTARTHPEWPVHADLAACCGHEVRAHNEWGCFYGNCPCENAHGNGPAVPAPAGVRDSLTEDEATGMTPNEMRRRWPANVAFIEAEAVAGVRDPESGDLAAARLYDTVRLMRATVGHDHKEPWPCPVFLVDQALHNYANAHDPNRDRPYPADLEPVLSARLAASGGLIWEEEVPPIEHRAEWNAARSPVPAAGLEVELFAHAFYNVTRRRLADQGLEMPSWKDRKPEDVERGRRDIEDIAAEVARLAPQPDPEP